MKEYSVIGKPTPQVNSVDKVTGRLKYINDIALPGMLHGKILRSPYAHARIIRIDTSKAERLYGVRAVATSKDFPMVKSGRSLGLEDEYPFGFDKVRHCGEEVAAVAAIDEDTAEEALDLIKIEYEEFPAVFEIEEAMKPGAPLVHDHAKNNIGYEIHHALGDVEKGFKEAYYIREDRFETPMAQGAASGPRCAVADYDPVNGTLTLYTDGNVIYSALPLFARIVGVPEKKLRVIRPAVACSFGNKGRMNEVGVYAAFLSLKCGRPVRIERTRAEDFANTRSVEPLVSYLKTGVKKDGRLVAMQCRHLSNSGAYLDFSPWDARQNVGVFSILFNCPNVKFDGYCVYTNTIPSAALRGLTNRALNFAQNSHLDMLARDLGMDVVDFYLKNAHQKGDVTAAKYKLDSCGLIECIQQVSKASGWKEKRGKLPAKRGIGFAATGHTGGFRAYGTDLSTVLVEVDDLGGVKVISGRSEYGQGPSTMIVMCVAEELGLGVEDITINEFTDTLYTPWECGNYGSRGTVQQGNAAISAGKDVKRQLFEVVAEKLGTTPDKLEAKDKRIFIRDAPDKGVSFLWAVKDYRESGKPMPLVGRGYYDPPSQEMDLKTGEGNVAMAYAFGAQIAEVEVDTETGKVTVLKVTSASDCGKALNPLVLNSESEGGVSMGLGTALFEEITYDEKGRVLQTTYADYRLPSVWQQPEVKTIWVETIDPHGPYGAKGITEIVSLPTAAAMANAICDAIGVRIRKLPMLPWKILDALKEEKTGIKGKTSASSNPFWHTHSRIFTFNGLS